MDKLPKFLKMEGVDLWSRSRWDEIFKPGLLAKFVSVPIYHDVWL
jgi:hypothetical protein